MPERGPPGPRSRQDKQEHDDDLAFCTGHRGRLRAVAGDPHRGDARASGARVPLRAVSARGASSASISPSPACALILIGDEIAGCVGFRVGDAEIKIDSFYLARRYHNRGLGAEILKVLLAEADALGLPCELDVLLGSPADRFYERHGFVKQGQDDIEANFRRPISRG